MEVAWAVLVMLGAAAYAMVIVLRQEKELKKLRDEISVTKTVLGAELEETRTCLFEFMAYDLANGDHDLIGRWQETLDIAYDRLAKDGCHAPINILRSRVYPRLRAEAEGRSTADFLGGAQETELVKRIFLLTDKI